MNQPHNNGTSIRFFSVLLVVLLLLVATSQTSAIQFADKKNLFSDSAFPPLYNETYAQRHVSQVCVINPAVESEYVVLNVFNGCFRYLLGEWIGSFYRENLSWISAASQVILDKWLHAEGYQIILLTLVCTLPYFMSVYDDQFTRESASRFAYYLIHLFALMMRLALSTSFSLYLPLIIRQEAPCLCTDRVQFYNSDKVLVQEYQSYPLLLSPASSMSSSSTGNGMTWTMPAYQLVVSSVLFCHVMERYSFVLGLVMWSVVIPVSSLLSGYYSLGQILSAVALGLFLHFYMTRTPLLMRIIDFIFHLIAGLVTLFLVKNFNKHVMLQETVALYAESLLWFLFAGFCLVCVFSWSFVRMIIIRRTLYTLRAIDIQYMSHMDLVPDRSDLADSLNTTAPHAHDDNDSAPLLKGSASLFGGSSDASSSGGSSSVLSSNSVFTRFYNAKRTFHMIVMLLAVVLFTIQCVKFYS